MLAASGTSVVSFMIRWLVAFCLLASSSVASARDVALVKIRLDEPVNFYDGPACEPTEPGKECIQMYGWSRYRATLLRTYGGRVPHRRCFAVRFEHSFSATPVEMYAIVEPSVGEGRLRWKSGEDVIEGEYVNILWSNLPKYGFCFSPDEDPDGELKKAGLADAIDELRRDHPCTVK